MTKKIQINFMNIQYLKNNTEPTDFIYQVNIDNRIYFLLAPDNHLYRAVILTMPEFINLYASRVFKNHRYQKARIVAVFKIKKNDAAK